jgi:hypothetical protein
MIKEEEEEEEEEVLLIILEEEEEEEEEGMEAVPFGPTPRRAIEEFNRRDAIGPDGTRIALGSISIPSSLSRSISPDPLAPFPFAHGPRWRCGPQWVRPLGSQGIERFQRTAAGARPPPARLC